MAIEISRGEFEDMVGDAIDALPPGLLKQVRSVAFAVQGTSPDDVDGIHRFATYQGLPLGVYEWGFEPPRVVTFYQDPICAVCVSDEHLREWLPKLLKHELGHAFGMDHEQLGRLGYA